MRKEDLNYNCPDEEEVKVDENGNPIDPEHDNLG